MKYLKGENCSFYNNFFFLNYSYFLLQVKYLFSEIPMFLKNTQIRSKTKLKLQFCRSRLKNEQNRRIPFDVGICKILIKSQFLSLVIIKTLVLVSDSILFPNTRSFTLTTLHLKPKVINILDKIWFIKTNLQQKMFHFQPNFFFI